MREALMVMIDNAGIGDWGKNMLVIFERRADDAF